MLIVLKHIFAPLFVLIVGIVSAVIMVDMPDSGQEIAYTADTLRDSTIERMDVRRGLTIISYRSERRINGIAWSPDGDTLYFGGVNTEGRYRDLGALSVHTGEVNWLTADDADNSSPDVSPDGRLLVFQRYTNNGTDWDIYTLDLHTGEVHPLYAGISADTAPDWSPDGRFIAFETASIGRNSANIMLYDRENAGTTRITTRLEGLPEWSNDGTSLYYSSDQQGSFNIYQMRVNDGIANPNSAQRLTNFTAGSLSPAMSPSGRQIAFVSWDSLNAMMTLVSSTGGINYSQIFLMSPDGTDLRQLTTAPVNHTNPVWRP